MRQYFAVCANRGDHPHCRDISLYEEDTISVGTSDNTPRLCRSNALWYDDEASASDL